jgi:hypothetical protein
MVQAEMIPHNDFGEYIDFITRTVAFHSGLAGPISKAAVFFSDPMRITTGDKLLEKNVNAIFRDLKVFWNQYKAWMGVFMYDQVGIIYLPKQNLFMECPECKETFHINGNSYDYPFKIQSLDYDRDSVRKLKNDAKLHSYEKRKHATNYGIGCVCPECNTSFIDTPRQEWDFNSSGRMMVLNPKMFKVETNDAGEDRMIIDPKYYEGPLALDKEIESFHLKGVPWNLAVTYAAKDRVYIPDDKWYMTFSMREYIGVGNAGAGIAPIMSSVSDTISMDIFKMGNEGLALSKIDPLYVVSPHSVNNPAYEGISHQDMRDFMVGGIKAHQEGDINRILYSPIPVTTDALFGDGKRFMHVQEFITFQNFVLGGLGLSADALNGSSGFTADPVMFEGWNKLRQEFNFQYTELVENVLKLVSPKYYENSKTRGENEVKATVWIPNLSQLRGGMDLAKKWELIDQEKLPFDEFTYDLGIPKPELWEESIINSMRQQMKLDLKKGRVAKRLHETEMEKDNAGGSESGPNMALARKNILDEAEYYAQELMNMDDGQRRTYLAQIRAEDFVLHAVVMEKLKQFRKMDETQSKGEGQGQPQ